ncbi:MAG: hypothetical protein AAF514_14850 [Verrucomicrobiota bacterium]
MYGKGGLLGGKGAFRMTGGNTVHGNLINFLVRSGGAHTRGQVDDIYLASGENLTIPQPVLDSISDGPDDDVPEILSVSRSASGIALTLAEGVAYDIEYSADLITWEPIATDVTGSFEDTDAARAGRSRGYCRGVGN